MNGIFKAAVAVLIPAFGFSGSVASGPFEDGLNAAERRDYATAIRLWRPLANQGNADAQYNLGVMFDKGDGVPQDRAAAVSWFRMAADQGLAAAQSNLGIMYEYGLGVGRHHRRRRTADSLDDRCQSGGHPPTEVFSVAPRRVQAVEQPRPSRGLDCEENSRANNIRHAPSCSPGEVDHPSLVSSEIQSL